MATLHLIHGFVGAGKTTYSKKLEAECKGVLYSPDEWMCRLHGSNPPAAKFNEYLSHIVFDIETEAARHLKDGRDVIFDFGLWARAERDKYRTFAKDLGVNCIMHHIFAAPNVMKERVLKRTSEMPEGQLRLDENAIEEFRKRYDPPGKDEEYVTIRTG